MDRKAKAKNRLSIIVIEDNQGDYVLVEDYLYEKFKPITIEHYLDFKSVSASLQKDDKKCDLILLDLNLPDKSGIELINEINALSSHIPIIILTGYADIPLAKRSLELGVYDFLVKDEVNPDLLHKSIEFAISRNSYVRQIERQNEKLKTIAWTQSHVVRAPLSRMLGIIDMIENIEVNEKELPFWLEQLKASSNELDGIIRSIVDETNTLKLNK
ncbi:MAG: response regulator [Flavobacteriaceae bacterium]